MIPVYPLSPVFFVLLTLGFWASIGLAALGAVLVASPRARVGFRRHPKMSVAAMTVLTLLAMFHAVVHYNIWRIQQTVEQQQQALRITLAQMQSVEGIAMPEGTRLHTLLPGQEASFTEAVFPSPTPVRHFPVLRMTRTVQHTGQRGVFRVAAMALTLAEDADVEGWRCGSASPMTFHREGDSGEMAFASCALAAGQRVGEVSLPAGAILRASKGTFYTDGSRDSDRWIVMPEDGPDRSPIIFQGLSLRDPRLYFDASYRLVRLSDGVLSEPLTWGPLRYPAGTQVQTVPTFLSQRHPGAWVFSPVSPTSHAGQPDVTPGRSVVQMPSGEVRAIVPNAEVGVWEFTGFTVEGTSRQ